MVEKVPFTPEGLEKAREDLKQLKTVERPAIIEAVATARAHGDLSENAEYSSAREKQSFIEGRIKDLEDKIGRAEVIDASRLGKDRVQFGLRVMILDLDSGEKKNYRIVGEYEADLAQLKISLAAPIARAMMGKSVGDTFEIQTPRGAKEYEIVSIT